MTEPIIIPVLFEGASEASSDIQGLSRSVDQLSEQTTASATAAINLGQRLAGAASAVQSLVGQLGGQSRTAGLIGASIQTSVQFAQLGMLLGPGGAVVGGIVGAAIPAFSALREEMAVATSQVDDTIRSLNDLTAAYEAAREAAALQSRLADGTASLAEATDAATRAQARYDDEAVRHHTLLEQNLDAAERVLAQQQYAAPWERAQAQQTVDQARAELEANTALIASLQEEAEKRTTIASIMQTEADARERVLQVTRSSNALSAETSRGGRSSSGPSRSDAEQARYDAAAAQMTADADGAIRLADAQAAAERQIADEVRAHREEVEALQEAEQAQYEARAQQMTDAADAAIRFAQAQAEAEQIALDATSRAAEKEKQLALDHQRTVEENMSSTFSSIIGSMTDVISQIAEGNATAEEGAQMMLAAFLQTLSQMAQVQALAEVARAISSYPDVAGIAAHVAGALAWGAVAVATGVGGAAISGGVSRAQAARKDAERPASPHSSGVSGGSNGGTTVINFNGPVVTAQGEATLGRMINGYGRAAERRFPGDR